MTGGGKQPKVDHTQTDSMNLKVLRRDDPSIQTILGSASSIAMYELDMQTTKWHRKNVEGSLFVVERKKSSSNSSSSRFQFIVLNRLSDERFVESIAKDAEFEMSEKYLLYKTDTDEVNGVWFYDEKEQTNIYEIIQRAQEMERSGIYANNGEEGGGGGGGPVLLRAAAAPSTTSRRCFNRRCRASVEAPKSRRNRNQRKKLISPPGKRRAVVLEVAREKAAAAR